MNNRFCITKENLVKLFWNEVAQNRISLLYKNFSHKYSLQETFRQAQTGEGEAGKFTKEENKKFAEKTENTEIVNAITLADFYFPNFNPEICFEMKNGFNEKIKNCEMLIKNIESNTEIDFSIKDKDKIFNFQLKEYPEEYKEWNTFKVIEYFDKAILPKEKYNVKSNKDLIITISIKPKIESNFKEVKDFKEIHEYLKKKNIKLAEINFFYNRNCEHMVWFQVFPAFGHYKIPWDKLSYHKAKRPTV